MAGMFCSLPTLHIQQLLHEPGTYCYCSCRGSLTLNIIARLVRDFDGYEADVGPQVMEVVHVSTTELACEVEPRCG